MLFAMTDATVMWVVNAFIGFGTLMFGGVMAYLYARLKHQEALNRELDSRRISWREIAKEGRQTTQDMANVVLGKEGLPPVVQVAPVVSESHSPSTEKQRDEADISTEKAAIAAIRLAIGQPPRPEPDRAGEKPVVTVSDVRTAVKDALTEKVDAVKTDTKAIRKDVEKVKDKLLDDKP